MDVSIRGAEAGDLDALYDICLRTGDAGGDASGLVADPMLLGHVYVGPYAVLQPDLAFVAVDDDGVGGYVVGAADTRAFEARLEREWLPDLRRRYPDGSGAGLDGLLVGLLHRPSIAAEDVVASYPAHLHVDLLPRLQGRGVGRRLMATFHDTCRARGAPGVHLRVSQRNTTAIGFYRRLGYEVLAEDPSTLTLGLAL